MASELTAKKLEKLERHAQSQRESRLTLAIVRLDELSALIAAARERDRLREAAQALANALALERYGDPGDTGWRHIWELADCPVAQTLLDDARAAVEQAMPTPAVDDELFSAPQRRTLMPDPSPTQFATWYTTGAYKSSIVIEALQFTGNNCYDVLRFIGREGLLSEGLNDIQQTDCPVIPTLEGDLTASPGDWIIRGINGEFYPCKPDIFAATYEPATPTPTNAEAWARAEAEKIVDVDPEYLFVSVQDGNGRYLVDCGNRDSNKRLRRFVSLAQNAIASALLAAVREQPITVDGVPLRPAMRVWRTSDATVIDGERFEGWKVREVFSETPGRWKVRVCGIPDEIHANCLYSTYEAARAASKENP